MLFNDFRKNSIRLNEADRNVLSNYLHSPLGIYKVADDKEKDTGFKMSVLDVVGQEENKESI